MKAMRAMFSRSAEAPAPATASATAQKTTKATAKPSASESTARSSTDGIMDQIRVIIGRNHSETVATTESFTSTCPSLTKTQRMWGFGICFVLGYIISFGSTLALIAGNRSATKFGVMYTIGNILALCGSGFLVGPAQQVKLMMKPVRRVAAMIYVGMIIVVLAVAIAFPNLGGLVLILALIQFLAAVWYAASYVPYGRKIITNICSKTCNMQLD